jgi:hypothetical protein
MKLELHDEDAAALAKELYDIREIASRQAWGDAENGGDRARVSLLDAVCGLAAKHLDGLADPEDLATELGVGLYEVTELIRRYQEAFDWASVPIGKLRPRRDCP